MAETNVAEPVEPGIPAKDKRQHKATFAKDKRNLGSYLIRVEGPTAERFAGRRVPVTRRDGSESIEQLTDGVWSGVDEESHQPVALYHFVARERDTKQTDDLPF